MARTLAHVRGGVRRLTLEGKEKMQWQLVANGLLAQAWELRYGDFDDRLRYNRSVREYAFSSIASCTYYGFNSGHGRL